MLDRHLPGSEGGAHLMRMHSSSLADLHQQLVGVEEAAAGVANNCSIAFPLDLVELAEPAPSTSGSEGTTVRARCFLPQALCLQGCTLHAALMQLCLLACAVGHQQIGCCMATESSIQTCLTEEWFPQQVKGSHTCLILGGNCSPMGSSMLPVPCAL